MEVVVRADRYGGVRPTVSDVIGKKSLSVATIDWYQSSSTTASAGTSGRVPNLLLSGTISNFIKLISAS